MNRKKISVIFVLVIAVAIIAAITLQACSFIVKNEYREANEVVITVENNGIKLTVTKNELNDYFYTLYSQSAQAIQQGYYTVDKILDYALKGKMQSTYLLTEAMPYLTDASKVGADRVKVLVGKGSKVKPVDVLTEAEKSAAIFAVNKSIYEQVERTRLEKEDDAIKDKYDDIVKANKISSKDVKAIEFTEDTLAYLKDRYVVGSSIQKEKVQFVIVYDNGSKSKPLPAYSGLYKTAFSFEFPKEDGQPSKKTTEKKKVEIIFKEEVTKDGKSSFEEHSLTYEYELYAPRATKDKVVPESDDKIIVFAKDKDIDREEVRISRYATVEELKAAKVYYTEIDPKAILSALQKNERADKNVIKGYEDFLNNMDKAFKNMDYYYKSSYETAVMSALQAENNNKTLSGITDKQIEDAVVAEFDFLYKKDKDSYKEGTDEQTVKDNQKAYIGKVTNGLTGSYYYPAIPEIADKVYYVYNILFNFSEEEKATLEKLKGDDEALEQYKEHLFQNYMKTRAANPDYDPDHECPLHKLNKEGAECSYDGEGICPAVPFGKIVDGKLVAEYEESVKDVVNRLENELKAIYNDANLDEKAKSKKALEHFEKYMYIYNEDPGIMNNSVGYLGQNESFQQSFKDLAAAVYSYSPKTGNAFEDKDGTPRIAYRFSSYGLHLTAISFVPFSAGDSNKELKFANREEKLAFLKKDLDNKGTTFYDSIKKSVLGTKKTDAYTKFTVEHTPENMYERNEKNNKITLDKSVKGNIKIKGKVIKKFFDTYLGKTK